MAITTTGGSIGTLVAKYYDRLLLDNLYPDLYFYQFGDKKRIPQNTGKTVYFNRWTKLGAAPALTEGTAITASSMSAATVSAVLSGFGNAVQHADFFVMTAISDVIEGSIKEVSKALALAIDNKIRGTLSAKGTYIGAGNATEGSCESECALNATDIIRGMKTLNAANAKPFPDGYFGGIIHPQQVYDIQGDTATGGWIDVNKYATDQTVGNLYRGEVGRLYGVRFVMSSNVKKAVGAGIGIPSGESCYVGWVVGPGTYGVVDLDGANAKTYVKQLGTGGASGDPINQIASVGAKIYFAPVDLDCTNRMLRLTSGVST